MEEGYRGRLINAKRVNVGKRVMIRYSRISLIINDFYVKIMYSAFKSIFINEAPSLPPLSLPYPFARLFSDDDSMDT